MLATEKRMLDEPMTNDEALNWILRVDGRLFRTPTKLAVEAWVAVVRVPAASPRKKWIIGCRDWNIPSREQARQH